MSWCGSTQLLGSVAMWIVIINAILQILPPYHESPTLFYCNLFNCLVKKGQHLLNERSAEGDAQRIIVCV